MVFKKRVDFLNSQAGIALGGAARFELTREFHIESIYLVVDFTVTGVAATMNADGLYNILKRVTLKGSDGARTRSIVDATGRGLIEYARNILGGVDRNYINNVGNNTATAKTLIIPIYFALPQVADPVGSAFLIPAPRFNNNLELNIQVASQADMDTNGAPTFAAAAGVTIRVIVNRREVNDPNFITYDTELAEISQPFPAAGANQLYELQVPGAYTGLLMRGFTSVSALGDVSTANGEFKLQALGNVIRRFRLTDVQFENETSYFGPTTPTSAGVFYLDFLTDRAGEGVAELGSVLDTNFLMATGARAQLLCDVNGGANVKINFLSHRVFGDLRALKMVPKAA